MDPSQLIFRLNVGFIIHETPGYSREFPVDEHKVYLPPDLLLEHLQGKFLVTRLTEGLLVQTTLKSELELECAHCLELYMDKLDINTTELYAFHSNPEADTDLLVPESGILDLREMVREEILIAIPISPQCKSGCKGLCKECGANLNLEDCGHRNAQIDPRLSILGSLLDQADLE